MSAYAYKIRAFQLKMPRLRLIPSCLSLAIRGDETCLLQSGIALGLRGGIAFEVEAQTVDVNLHSGAAPCLSLRIRMPTLSLAC